MNLQIEPLRISLKILEGSLVSVGSTNQAQAQCSSEVKGKFKIQTKKRDLNQKF